MLTLRDSVETIAHVERTPSETASLLLRRHRLLATKGAIPVRHADSGWREGRLDLEGACLAYVFSTLIDLGFEIATLLTFRRTLSSAKPGQESAIAGALRLVRAGTPVSLEITLWLDTRSGEKHFAARVPALDEPRSPRVDAALRHVRAQGTITVPLNALFEPFIAVFESAVD